MGYMGDLWTALQLYTQKRIADLSHMILARPELISDGRYIYLFMDSKENPGAAAEIVRQFGRAMIYLPTKDTEDVTRHLTDFGFQVKVGLSAFTGTADEVLRVSEAIVEKFALPAGLTVHHHADIRTAHEINDIQVLQLSGGLVPLPQDDILHPQTCGVIVRNASSAIVGYASLLSLESQGQRPGWYQVNGVCIDVAYRGRGLGTFLTARSILAAREKRPLTRFICSVENENAASIKMHLSCGLRLDTHKSSIFAKLSQQQEVSLLSGTV